MVIVAVDEIDTVDMTDEVRITVQEIPKACWTRCLGLLRRRRSLELLAAD